MKLLMESWRKYLNESVYSDELHSFIQYSYEIDNARFRGGQKLKYLKNYLNSHFKYLGSGVERIAYQSSSGEVVKLASSISGLSANKREVVRFNRNDIEAFPRIMAYDKEDFWWFVVENVTQIGKENTWEKYSKLFPKLFLITEEVYEKQGIDIKSSSRNMWPAAYVIINLLEFKYFQKHRSDYYKPDLDNSVRNAFKILPPAHDRSMVEVHKFAVDAVIKYFKDPDKNFARLARAVQDAKVSPADFHYNNLGYDDDWNIKIMDAG